jgi:hypothetical protein
MIEKSPFMLRFLKHFLFFFSNLLVLWAMRVALRS